LSEPTSGSSLASSDTANDLANCVGLRNLFS
jgi:hypothetical protein